MILNITTNNHMKLVMVAKLEQYNQLKNLNNKMICKFIDEYDLSNSKIENDYKETFLNYIKQRNQELKIIIDKINDIKSVLGNWSIGFCIYDFAHRKYLLKNNKHKYQRLQRNI